MWAFMWPLGGSRDDPQSKNLHKSYNPQISGDTMSLIFFHWIWICTIWSSGIDPKGAHSVVTCQGKKSSTQYKRLDGNCCSAAMFSMLSSVQISSECSRGWWENPCWKMRSRITDKFKIALFLFLFLAVCSFQCFIPGKCKKKTLGYCSWFYL